MNAAEDIKRRFSHHPPSSPRVIRQHKLIREDAQWLAEIFSRDLPEGREKALALTKLEEALMWANAAIARNQGAVDGSE